MPPAKKPARKPRKRTTKPKKQPLSRQEAVAILEEIARTSGNAAARIAAIKQLEAMNDGKQASAEGFAALDG